MPSQAHSRLQPGRSRRTLFIFRGVTGLLGRDHPVVIVESFLPQTIGFLDRLGASTA
jgi:hypothetical protein